MYVQVWLWYDEDLEFLPRRVASQDQYLVVKHRDGRKESIPGCVNKTSYKRNLYSGVCNSYKRNLYSGVCKIN